jgi:tyrosyl-tRNA synthetase
MATTNFIQELQWRGMIHDMMPGTEEMLNQGVTAGYIGFDPTADSLHIGHLVQIMTLVHFQRAGHKPFALVGGATGMVGDPSGKSAERNLLDLDTIMYNQQCVEQQLSKFLDFNCGENSAQMVNNYDWFKNMTFLDFIRDVGKHLSINYMMSKDSVQKRLETGLSFTEFSYQLVQGYDFYWLWKNKGCKLQMGGSDQWGNIVTGTELIRRKGSGEAFAVTTPLITKADGTKFGKTEGGNVWLDPQRTSAYKFYQYWLNTADNDAMGYIKIFTLGTKQEIDDLIEQHQSQPHNRLLQKALAQDITTRVHGHDGYQTAVQASEILFGKGTADILKTLSKEAFLEIFEGVPMASISKGDIEAGLDIVDAMAGKTGFLTSNGEVRRALSENAVSVNKEKVTESRKIAMSDLIGGRYVLLQKGKKNYYILKVE